MITLAQQIADAEQDIAQLEEECSRLRSSISNCNQTLRNLNAAIKDYYFTNELTGDLGQYVGRAESTITPLGPGALSPQVARDPFTKKT